MITCLTTVFCLFDIVLDDVLKETKSWRNVPMGGILLSLLMSGFQFTSEVISEHILQNDLMSIRINE